MSQFEIVQIVGGSVTSVPGFEASAVSSGLKPQGALDLAVVYSTHPCVGAAIFTTNAFKAAPVLYDQETLGRNRTNLRAVVINSGCANACTGDQGMCDARSTASAAATVLGVTAQDVMVMSTGVIGMRLPMDKILPAVGKAAGNSSASQDAGHAAARAIMTTDTRPKESAVRVVTAEGDFVIAGMAKGAGMIHPNMATMLCLLTSSAKISPELAQKALEKAMDDSFHMITIDGDTSTNDTALLLANGTASMPPIASSSSAGYKSFVGGLTHVAVDLAKGIVRDGEGATKLIEITVCGARTRAEAQKVAMSVSRSLLVKTAIYGQDANWGRIVCAVGYSGVDINPARVGVSLDGLELFRDGAPYDVNEERASEILSGAEIGIGIDLGQGSARATVWTCDLSHDYVTINAHYRT